MTHHATAVFGTVSGSLPGIPVWLRMLSLGSLLTTWGLFAIPKYRARWDRHELLYQVPWTIMCIGMGLGSFWLSIIGMVLMFSGSLIRIPRGGKPMDRAAVVRTFVSKEPPAEVRGQSGDGSATDIVLADAGSRYIEVVRELRLMYGASLGEAVSATKLTPITLRERVFMAEAEYVKSRLEAYGASIAFERPWPHAEHGAEGSDAPGE